MKAIYFNHFEQDVSHLDIIIASISRSVAFSRDDASFDWWIAHNILHTKVSSIFHARTINGQEKLYYFHFKEKVDKEIA